MAEQEPAKLRKQVKGQKGQKANSAWPKVTCAPDFPAMIQKPKALSLDPKSGGLKLDEWETIIGPKLTRKEFLASPVGRASTDLIVNEPWHSFKLDCRIDGLPFGLAIFFEDEALEMIWLGLADPKYGTSWEDYSEQKERARHAAHRRWLSKQFKDTQGRAGPGGERQFAWGNVWAGYDQRQEESSIFINYQRREKA